MTFETIEVEKDNGIAVVRLNRPQRLNAWTPQMGAELLAAFRDIDRDATVRVAILTGAGRAFCAGADMDFFAAQIAAGGRTSATGPSRVEEFPALMPSLSKPVIAAINGYALGVGCTMTLLCDVRITADKAQVRFEGFTLDYLYRTHDHAEAVRAFREKRAPEFSGQ